MQFVPIYGSQTATVYETPSIDGKLDAFLDLLMPVIDGHCVVKTVLPRLKDGCELPHTMQARDTTYQMWRCSGTSLNSDRERYRVP